MCCTPPPPGNRSQKQPPGFASTERLRASWEKVCAGSHQPPTPSVSAAYTFAGGALIAAVFRTRKPVAVLSTTSPRTGATRIAKRITRVTVFDRIVRFLSADIADLTTLLGESYTHHTAPGDVPIRQRIAIFPSRS